MPKKKIATRKVQSKPVQAQKPAGNAKRMKALPKQADFFLSQAKYTCFAGGFGAGKTMAACWRVMKECQDRPIPYLVGRKHFPALRDSTMRTWFELFPATRPYYRSGEHTLYLPNGSVVMFRHLDDLGGLTNITLGGIFVDQAEEIDETIWRYLMGRLRHANSLRRASIVCNPAGHDWIWRRWKKETRPDYRLVEATTVENPHLPTDYVMGLLEDYPEDWVKRYVYGSWDVFEGQIWKDFVPERDVIDPFPVPQEWERGIVLDHGYRNATAALFFTVDYDGTIYIYDEHYAEGQLISHHASEIKHKIGSGRINTFLIDPSCLHKTYEKNGRQYSVADEYGDYGLYFYPANNDVKAGINRVGEMFRKERIKIFRNCVHTIEEVGQYRWSDAKFLGRDPQERPLKRHDHTCFVAGTKVLMADMNEKPIEDVRIGDEVITKTGAVHVVTDVQQFDNVPIRILFFAKHIYSTLHVTEDHKIYMKDGSMKAAGDLVKGDRVKTLNGDACIDVSLRMECAKSVYGITVDRAHNYYANRVLVHNCDCLRYYVMSRPVKAERKRPVRWKTRDERVWEKALGQLLRVRDEEEELIWS